MEDMGNMEEKKNYWEIVFIIISFLIGIVLIVGTIRWGDNVKNLFLHTNNTIYNKNAKDITLQEGLLDALLVIIRLLGTFLITMASISFIKKSFHLDNIPDMEELFEDDVV